MLRSPPNVFFVQQNSSNTRQPSDVGNSEDMATVRSYKPDASQFRSIWRLIPNINVNCEFSDAFYGLFVLVIVIIAPISITLVPVSNVLTNPEYWYEILYSSTSLTIIASLIPFNYASFHFHHLSIHPFPPLCFHFTLQRAFVVETKQPLSLDTLIKQINHY